MSCVLVVEDDDDVRASLRDVLEDDGYVVHTAVHGRDALDALARGPRPCLVLTDLQMPVMSGPELLDRMRSDPELSQIPVLVLSILWRAELPEGTRRLRKPMGLKALLREVAGACARTAERGEALLGLRRARA